MKTAKLAIGTVQFGMDYGISNTHGVTSEQEVKNILDLAHEHNITILDTARAYGNSEKVLGSFDLGNFNIISKFKGSNIEEQLNKTIQLIGKEKLYGYLIHDVEELLSTPSIWPKLVSLKEKEHIQKIGVSLYTPTQLERMWDLNIIPDIVQLPYNVLDKKFTPFFKPLKEQNTEIHIRSVFLQGLFFLGGDQLPTDLTPLKEPLNKLKSLSEQYGMTIHQLALNYVLHNEWIDYAVLGVSHVEQLKQNIACIVEDWDEELNNTLNNLIVEQSELLNSANWK